MFRLLLLFLFLLRPDAALPASFFSDETEVSFTLSSGWEDGHRAHAERGQYDLVARDPGPVRVSERDMLTHASHGAGLLSHVATDQEIDWITSFARPVSSDFEVRNSPNTKRPEFRSEGAGESETLLVEVMLPASFVPMLAGLVLLAIKGGAFRRRQHTVYHRTFEKPAGRCYP